MNKVSAIPSIEEPQPYRVSADEYLRMIEVGLFRDTHVELVDGVLTEMAPSSTQHARLLMEVGRLLGNACADAGFELFGDVVTRLDADSVRAPDIALVDREIGDRRHLLPEDILLAVEIADSTLAHDISRKRQAYAVAGIRHYWVVDIAGQRVHCHSDPQDGDYATVTSIAFGDPVPVPGTAATITVG